MKINYDNLAKFIEEQVGEFSKTKLALDQYCALRPETDFALMDACLQLAELSPTEISKVGSVKAPPSCWYVIVRLYDAGPSKFESGLKLVKDYKPSLDREPLIVKLRQLIEGGKQLYPSVGDLKIAYGLAGRYSALTDKESDVVKSLTAYLRKNGHLTPKQVSWLKSLIEKIHSKKVSGKTKEEAEALKRLYDWIS
jgi:hypothetical protein